MAPNSGAPKDAARDRDVDLAPREAHTLPRARRIRKRAEFVDIQQSAARVTTRNLLMLLALRPDEGPARLGVVASRKVGPAVVRNRAKRLVREAFRSNPDVFPSRLDVVIVVRPGTHQLGAEELADQVRRARPHLERRVAELTRGSRPRMPPGSPPSSASGARDLRDLENPNRTREPREPREPCEIQGSSGPGRAGDAQGASDPGRAGDAGEASALPEEHALERLHRR